MKRYTVCLAAALCLLLGGCSWMDGSYVSVKPHQQQVNPVQDGVVSVSNYYQLRDAMTELVEGGYEKAVIRAGSFDQNRLPKSMENVVHYIREILPLGAYAVDGISYEIGTVGGEPAVSVTISYIHGRSEIRNIQNAQNVDEAKRIIDDALKQCNEEVVLRVESYSESDLTQYVQDYAREHPDLIMEVPRVAVGVYPYSGSERIVEVEFSYQTSREALRQMQTQVQQIFESACAGVDSQASAAMQYTQLFSALMEGHNYQLETSITPSYSLLCHGVGDSQTMASVYAAMCRQVGLECRVVSGTRAGNAWHWNLILDDVGFAYVDLLQSREAGHLVRLTRGEMQGYVWDYSAYPDGAG